MQVRNVQATRLVRLRGFRMPQLVWEVPVNLRQQERRRNPLGR